MHAFLDDTPSYLRPLWKMASWSLGPTILGAVGFAYIGIPEELQLQVRRVIPYAVRTEMLHLWPANAWIFAVLIMTVIFAVWGAVGSSATSRFTSAKYKKLKQEYIALKSDYDSKSIDCYRLFSNYLYSISTKLGLGAEERISLYKLDFEQYLCIGRFSENESYKAKSERLYPVRQGCISKAWEIGQVSEGSSPDPVTQWADYARYHSEKYGFSEAELATMRMKSRSYFGLRLQNPNNQTIAVLMLESTNASGLPFGKITRLLTDVEKRHLAALIDSLDSHMPSLETANAEGF